MGGEREIIILLMMQERDTQVYALDSLFYVSVCVRVFIGLIFLVILNVRKRNNS